ncbi:MAG: right-handed parallel beta-helix repeat-containing protein [Rhodospirillales bacterium]|nr:right-handed parallel beta-helix repeat-containing protein [Rhodospirillales bacterium]
MIRARTFSLLSLPRKAVLASTALVAAAFGVGHTHAAKAENPWDLEGSNFTKDTSAAHDTVLTQMGDVAYGTGDLDIEAYESVRILQDNSGSLFVAQDNKDDPTRILGSLQANGRVMVLDRDGIFFGPDSNVDVGSLIASTGDINQEALLKGAHQIVFTNPGHGTIENQGQITVSEAGLAAFVAPTVKNSGVINARLGKVAFAAGEEVTLDLYGDQLLEITAGENLQDALLENSGVINAEGGTVIMSARAAKDAVDHIINMNGVINASSVTEQGGRIILDGGDHGVVNVSGSVQANGRDGGSVQVTGQNINLTETADFQASGTEDTSGDMTIIARNAALVRGTYAAGGQIETSGLEYINIDADVSAGRWVIDPRDLWIRSQADLAVTGTGTAIDPFLPGGPGQSMLNVANIETALDAGTDVYITTVGSPGGPGTGDIEIYTNINKVAGGDAVLTLEAVDKIIFKGAQNGGITSTSGALSVVLSAVNDIYIDGAGITTNGGDLQVTTGGTVHVNKTVALGSGNAAFDAAAMALNADIDTTGILSGTAATVAVLSDQAEIQDGIDLAGANALVTVAAGTYHESLTLDKTGLRLEGANAGLSGTDAGRGAETTLLPNSPGMVIQADGVSVDGFEISGGDDGIRVENAQNVTLKNNVIHDVTNRLVYAEDSGDLYLEDNHAYNAMTGLSLLRSDRAFIAGNRVAQINGWNVQGDGIMLTDSRDAQILSNTVLNVGDEGIFARGPIGNLTIADNLVDGTGQRTAISGNGIEVYNAVGSATITGNTVRNADYEGIWVKTPDAASTFSIEGNTVENTTRNAIIIDGGAVLVSGNTIDGSGQDGIHLRNSDFAMISGNTIARAGEDGIDAATSDGLFIAGNNLQKTGAHGILVTGGRDHQIADNIIRRTMMDGVHLENFGTAWIYGNDIMYTGNDGIEVANGDFVSITGNAASYAGLLPPESAGEGQFGLIPQPRDSFEPDGIHVRNITGAASVDSAYGRAVEIEGNTVFVTIGDGIQILNAESAAVNANDVSRTTDDGIDLDQVGYMTVAGNSVSLTEDEAIDINTGYYAEVLNNDIMLGSRIGISVQNILRESGASPYGNGWDVTLSGNRIALTGSHGMEIFNSGVTQVANNDVTMTGLGFSLEQAITANNDLYGGGGPLIPVILPSARPEGDFLPVELAAFNHIWTDGHGIYVHDIDSGKDSPNGWGVDVSGNHVSWTGGHGILVENTVPANISSNQVTQAGIAETLISGVSGLEELAAFATDALDHISVDSVIQDNFDGIHVDTIGQWMTESGPEDGYNLRINGNMVAASGDDGIDAATSAQTLISFNSVDTSANDGVSVSDQGLVRIAGNTISNSADRGIFAGGTGNGDVVLAGNVLTNNDVHARFDSGSVDLTGIGNTFNNGRVGLLFDGPFVALIDHAPADGFQGTLGTQTFDGPSQSYVELQNQALFDPGQPGFYDALNSTYVTPLGTFTPNTLPDAGVLTVDQFNYLEGKFHHFPDQNLLGLFLFGGVASEAAPAAVVENLEDVFENFAPFNTGAGALRVTITGLPGLQQNQNAALLNNLIPAAGGEENGAPSPEELASIDPAAGGQTVGCWSDALTSLEGGAAVNYDLNNSLENLLADTAGCGVQQSQE